MYTTLSEGTEYYIHVDEVMKDPAAWKGKRLQLHGFVADLTHFAITGLCATCAAAAS